MSTHSGPLFGIRDTVRLCPLSSGSKGNCVFVGTPEGGVLIDVGLSARETFRRLALAGVAPEEVSAILVTHEHGDHIRGIVPVARKLQVPVYLSEGTWEAVGRPELPDLRLVVGGTPFDVGALRVSPQSLPHDAVEPVAYRIAWEGWSVGCVTDLGHPAPEVITWLAGCDLLYVEANHDEELLASGPYPWSVKQRIRGRFGHLSNTQGLAILEGMLHPGLRGIVLAHLSETCNRPELAWGLFKARLRSLGADHIPLWTAAQDHPLLDVHLSLR